MFLKDIGMVRLATYILHKLQIISNISAHQVSIISGKPYVHSIIFSVVTFKKCNPPDFKFYLSKLTNKNLGSVFFAFLYCLLQ